jgi:4-hydroxybenzoate polyprenyltransferase
MKKVKTYLSLIKFSHTIFAMPFAMIGFFLGILSAQPVKQMPAFSREGAGMKFLLVTLCMIFARSAAMAFNRYLDRDYDAKNPRTAVREIPSGQVSVNNAFWFTMLSSILFIVTCYFINALCFYLSPVALAIILGYSYTKRFTTFCHLILGLGLSLAPIGAYLAVTGYFSLLPILFSITVLFWVSGFDIIYAMQDEEFDRSQKLFSIPASLGKSKALHVSEFLHVVSAASVITAGIYGKFGLLYWAGTIAFTGMLIYQHRVVKPDDLRRVNLAFMTANGIASVVFSLFVIADIFIIYYS